MRIAFTPWRIFKSLIWVIFILIIFSSVFNLLGLYMESDTVKFFQRLFNVDYENNIPTYYSATALFASAILLFFIATYMKKQGDNYIAWFFLGLVFVFLSIDETSQIHEKLIRSLRDKWNLKGYLYNGWIIPYGIAAFLLFIGYFRFLLKLPLRTRILMIVSGFIFILGSVGFEMISVDIGFAHERNDKSKAYFFFMTLEELFEMLGIALFIYTLLDYISTSFGYLEISVSEKQKLKGLGRN